MQRQLYLLMRSPAPSQFSFLLWIVAFGNEGVLNGIPEESLVRVSRGPVTSPFHAEVNANSSILIELTVFCVACFIAMIRGQGSYRLPQSLSSKWA